MKAKQIFLRHILFLHWRKKVSNKKIIDLIHEGCELEDVESLCPDKLDNVIEDLKQRTLTLLDKYEEYKTRKWVQIDDVK